MTDKSHLKILEEGPEAWNSWRIEKPGVKPKLAAEDLTDMSYGSYNTMKGHFYGIRGLPSCYGNALFVRDSTDQDYLDTVENAILATQSTALRRWIGEILLVCEGTLGYVTLGLLLSILANRVARRS